MGAGGPKPFRPWTSGGRLPLPLLLTLHTTGPPGVLPGSPIRAGPGRTTLLAKPFCGGKCSFFFKQWAPSLRVWVFLSFSRGKAVNQWLPGEPTLGSHRCHLALNVSDEAAGPGQRAEERVHRSQCVLGWVPDRHGPCVSYREMVLPPAGTFLLLRQLSTTADQTRHSKSSDIKHVPFQNTYFRFTRKGRSEQSPGS